MKPVFVDLFAGCGGLSLGLLQAGWNGLFAIEENRDAFKSLKHNLINETGHNQELPKFSWPDWLKTAPFELGNFIDQHERNLVGCRGTVHLVAGGPPCQGFSFAGKRVSEDPRNELFKLHLRIVEILYPTAVLVENVRGIDVAFGEESCNGNISRKEKKTHATEIRHALEEMGYRVEQRVICSKDFGVPQSRLRHYTFGVRRDLCGD